MVASRRRGLLQRLGSIVGNDDTRNPEQLPSSSLERRNGPVCVDDFLEPNMASVIKKSSYFTEVVDLDDAVVPDGVQLATSSDSAETSSSSSNDDSYQADLREKKRVSFSGVTLRSYAATVSDSPNLSATYPIGLDWKHTEAVTLDLEEFEEQKSSRLVSDDAVLLRGFRRPKRLTPLDRFHRISDLSGLSHGEIYELEHARSRRHCSMKPPELVSLDVAPSKQPIKTYQVVDVDSGYHCVDI